MAPHNIENGFDLHDRDAKFCAALVEILEAVGIKTIKLPPRSPNLNANLERWHRSVKEEWLSKLILFGEASLRQVLSQYVWIIFMGRETIKARGMCSCSRCRRTGSVNPLAKSRLESGWEACSNSTTGEPHDRFDTTGMLRSVVNNFGNRISFVTFSPSRNAK